MKLSTYSLVLQIAGVLCLPEKLSTPLTLELKTAPWTALIENLAESLPKAGLSEIMSKLDHEGKSVTPKSPLVRDLRFTKADNSVVNWYPQGVTSTADSLATGKVDGVEAVLVSWYHKKETQGVRIGFHHPTSGKYVYALLVEPEESGGKPSYKALKGLHAGGIAWYGNHLYVVDTSKGIRIFNMDRILKVPTCGGIGLKDGKYCAHKYKYIIPQTASYTRNSGSDFRFSFIHLDRTDVPDAIVVGEYQESGDAGRIARFDINYQTRLLSTGTRTEMWRIGKTSIQGVATVKGKYFFARSRGASSKSELWTWNGKAGSKLANKGAILPPGGEDLSYWAARNQMWCLGEHPQKRTLYAFNPDKQ